MFKKITAYLFAILLAMLVACSADNQSQVNAEKFNFASDNGSITLPDGFQAIEVTEGISEDVGEARQLTIDEDGDIYVARRRTDGKPGIVALRDKNGDGIADSTEYFSKYTGTGIELHNNYLYFSTDTSIVRYPMEGVDLVPTSDAQLVVSGFPIQGPHASKPFTFDNNGNLYVNVGAPANACQEEGRTPKSPGQNPCPLLKRHAGIWQFAADKLGQTQKENGYRYATGLRNTFPQWNAIQNQLFAVQHGRDQLHSLWPEKFTEKQNAQLPAEEFLKVNDGDNFGWPYCYYDQIQSKKVLAPEYGGDGKKTGRCSEYKDPVIGFPGHWAPNGLQFYTGDQFPSKFNNGAFIAFHGSWNRAPLPQKGYKIVFVPFNNGSAGSSYETFADGFAGKDTLKSPGQAEYRPMDMAQGPNGTLYISDTEKGRIWRIVYTGSK